MRRMISFPSLKGWSLRSLWSRSLVSASSALSPIMKSLTVRLPANGIKTSTKTAIAFSLFTSLVIAAIGLTLTYSSYKIVNREIENDLLHEVYEISTDFITYSDNRIQYLDAEGQLMSEHLQQDGISAVLYTKDLQPIGAFGFLKQIPPEDLISKGGDHETLLKILQTHQRDYTVKMIGRSELAILNHPLFVNGKVVGIVQVVKPTNTIQKILSSNLITLTAVLAWGMVVSWLIGFYVSQLAFKPLKKMIAKIRSIQTNRLNMRLGLSGHPEDELTILSRQFNNMMSRIESGVLKQKEFLANVSHELKTPLTRAITSIEYLSLQAKEKESKNRLAKVKSDLFELNHMINNLLLLSKVIEKKVKRKNLQGRVKVKKEISEIIEAYQAEIEEKSLQIKIVVPQTLSIAMKKEYFKILVSNIISNAIKYSFKQTTIKITARKQHGETTLKIKDQGRGMNKEELKKIFRRRYRGKSGGNRVKGAGIGLSLVEEICTLYKIKIQVKSKPNRGTQVTLSLGKLIL